MRGNSLSFFKPPVFGKTVLIFCALFLVLLFNSCKQLASFDPGVEGARIVVNNTLSAPTGIVATHGLKRKISLEWIPVSGAKYYDIYCADSATAEFKKVGETVKNSFDHKVNAGETLYYKVCAVKYNHTQSPFSIIMRGASLAQPVITGGNVGENGVTISWFMENSRCINDDDNYEKSLKFNVCYKKVNGNDDWKKKTIDDAGSVRGVFLNSYEYSLTNLANAKSYQFYIESYTVDENSKEYCKPVEKTTMVSYVPRAPEFKVSEGTSAKKISLNITLPSMAMVHTVTKDSPGEEKDVEFPLYFTIYRKLESESDYKEIVEKLYCNGTTSAPAYSANLEETYKPDEVIEWIDTDSENLVGGEKYEYKIRSFVDIGYGTVVCPGTELTPPPGMYSDSVVGWKSAPPVFEINRSRFENNGLTLSKDKTKICSILFGFDVKWNDLGKASEYKFAIKQNKKPLNAENSDGGENKWLTNKDNGSNFFETIEEIASYEVRFGSENGGLSDAEKGLYSYTLYIIPKDAEFVEEEWSRVLDFKTADEIRVSDDVELPKAEFAVKGGYNDKVELIISNFESDVKYVVTRTRIEDGTQTGEAESVVLKLNDETPDVVEDRTNVYYDESVKDNCRYSYVLEATASSGIRKLFEPKSAETLGTPNVLFEDSELDYDSITISFENVLAANRYEMMIGKENDFAGGCKLAFTVEEIENSEDGTLTVNNDADYNKTTISFVENKFTVVIKDLYGYDKANLAGKSVEASVKACSDVDDASGSANVRVLGPALINATGGDSADNMITMAWDKVDGASGYLIYRIAYKDANATTIEGADVLYYPATDDGITDSPLLLTDEQAKGIVITKTDGKYTLKDTDTPAPESGASDFLKRQARISWGRPFGYIILPVKDKNDFAFVSDAKTLAESSKVNYTKDGSALAEAQGSTYGYGMNTAASKSDSVEDVLVEWVKPNAQTGLVPTVYRRVAGTNNSFNKVLKSAVDGSATDKPGETDKYEAFEYVVKYGKTEGGSTLSAPASLLAELADAKETWYKYPEGAEAEPQNKGYLFTVRLSAKIDESNTYYEAIDCDWDYTKRAIGPDTLTLSIYNNIKDDWIDVLSAAGRSMFSVKDGVQDITIKTTNNQGKFSIAPKGIAEGNAGTTDGMLKVLRDYKHYYKLYAERKNRGGSTIFQTVGADKGISAYRQITDEELLIVSMDTIRSAFKKKWFTTMGASSDLVSSSHDGNIDGTYYTGIDRNGFFGTNYRRYQRFENYTDSFVKVNGTMMKDNGSGTAAAGQYHGTWLHKGSSWPSDSNFNPRTDYLTVSLTYLKEEGHEGQIKLNSIKIDNDDANTPKWVSGTFEVTYNGKTETFDNTQIPFGFLMNDETFYNKVEEMCY